jgi:hypothetical protein
VAATAALAGGPAGVGSSLLYPPPPPDAELLVAAATNLDTLLRSTRGDLR